MLIRIYDFAQYITISHGGVIKINYNITWGGGLPIYYNSTMGGRGSLGTPNLYYVIYGRPLSDIVKTIQIAFISARVFGQMIFCYRNREGGNPLSEKICLVVVKGLPKFLANMTNETFQACHLGTHLAIEEMPQTVQPGQTRQTRLNCFVFY